MRVPAFTHAALLVSIFVAGSYSLPKQGDLQHRQLDPTLTASDDLTQPTDDSSSGVKGGFPGPNAGPEEWKKWFESHGWTLSRWKNSKWSDMHPYEGKDSANNTTNDEDTDDDSTSSATSTAVLPSDTSSSDDFSKRHFPGFDGESFKWSEWSHGGDHHNRGGPPSASAVPSNSTDDSPDGTTDDSSGDDADLTSTAILPTDTSSSDLSKRRFHPGFDGGYDRSEDSDGHRRGKDGDTGPSATVSAPLPAAST